MGPLGFHGAPTNIRRVPGFHCKATSPTDASNEVTKTASLERREPPRKGFSHETANQLPFAAGQMLVVG